MTTLLIYNRLLDSPSLHTLSRLLQDEGLEQPKMLPESSVILSFPDDERLLSLAERLPIVQKYRTTDIQMYPLFGVRGYILFDWKYHEMLGESSFLLATSRPKGWPRPPLDSLRLGVHHRRADARKVERLLPDYLTQWLRRATVRGALGEGAVVCRNRTLTFWDKRCDFELDWSQSGPYTLLWLGMAILEFGHVHAPVIDLAYDPDEERRYRYSHAIFTNTPDCQMSYDEFRSTCLAQTRGKLRGTVELMEIPNTSEE